MREPAYEPDAGRVIETAAVSPRARYQLLTSLVVPRPIGWLSTRSPEGVPNLAPFSYYAALSSTPMLVGVSIGARREAPKDTLSNIRDGGGFCVNLVSEALVGAMNESAADHPPEVDEFTAAGLSIGEATHVDAPYVEASLAVFECRLFREVDLGSGSGSLVIGEVVGVRLRPEVRFLPDSLVADPTVLRPIARLGGDLYTLLGEVFAMPRPRR